MSDKSPQLELLAPISSAAASRAKTSRSRAPAPASTASARAFGRSSPGSSVTFDPDSSSWRTCPLSDDEASIEFSGTWPRAGTMRRGIASPLPPSAPLTAAIGSSWSRGEYPTPSASSYGTSQNEGKVEHNRPATAGTPSLETWARAGGPSAEPRGPAWPTPLANDAKNPSPAAGQTRRSSPGLASAAAQIWPTPTAGDSKRSGSRVGSSTTEAHPGTSFTDATCRSGRPDRRTCSHGADCPGQLNPRFVLWMMGFPLDWLDRRLEPSETLSLFRLPKSSAE